MRWEVTVHMERVHLEKVADSEISSWKKCWVWGFSQFIGANNGCIYFFGWAVLFRFYFSKESWINDPRVVLWSIQSTVVFSFCLWFLSIVQSDFLSSAFISNVLVHCQRHKHVLNTGVSRMQGVSLCRRKEKNQLIKKQALEEAPMLPLTRRTTTLLS